jgi:hypothetical protein
MKGKPRFKAHYLLPKLMIKKIGKHREENNAAAVFHKNEPHALSIIIITFF